MAGIRLPPEDSDLSQLQPRAAAGDHISDDERSVAADSWSIKSDYGSTLDDDQRHADAAEALSAANFRAASDYSSDKDETDTEGAASMLGMQSYWDAAYADELSNFREHGHSGEVWFGADVMDVVVSWTKQLCINMSLGHFPNHVDNFKSEPVEQGEKYLSSWTVLDVGTGNGLLLQELAKQGFCELTGVDYSEGAIELARRLAVRDGFPNIEFLFMLCSQWPEYIGASDRHWPECIGASDHQWPECIGASDHPLSSMARVYRSISCIQVDDVLETKLERQFKLVMDKGTLDAIGLHPDGPIKRIMYWDSVAKLVSSGGILVITSCNSTKDELLQEVENFNSRRMIDVSHDLETITDQDVSRDPPFRYLNHVRTYPTFTFGGMVGSRVATVAFLRN